MFWIVLVGVSVVILAIISAVNHNNKMDAARQRVTARYKPSELFVSSEDQALVGLNFDHQKVILGSGKSERAFDFSQIVSVEANENGSTLTSTNRGSQVVGAAVGALALGGIGAIVGGLSGSSRSRSRLQSLSLRVIVDDRSNPVYSIYFFKSSSEKGVDPSDYSAKEARSKLDRFHAHLVNAMRTAQAEQEPAPIATPPSLADELHKLWKLKQAGILSDNEFTDQKHRMLGSTPEPRPATPQLPPPPSVANYSVVLRGCVNKITAIKCLREITDLGLHEAKRIVDTAPSIVTSGIGQFDAESMQSALVASGCTVSLEQQDA